MVDHFHPPLSTRRHWHSFHNAWATYLSADLNRKLPPGYFAEAHVQFGLEIDVAMFRDEIPPESSSQTKLSKPTCSIPFDPPEDRVEIRVFGSEEGPVLAAAIELVSPANKDREESRSAFSNKCIHLLSSGAGVLVVDLVTSRKANLAVDIQNRMQGLSNEKSASIYTVSFRPVIQKEDSHIEIWEETLKVGEALPEMTLAAGSLAHHGGFGRHLPTDDR